MKEVFNRTEEWLNARTTLPITGFTLRRGQISGPVAPVLWRGFAKGLGQGSQNFDAAQGTSRNQIAIIIACIQQQGSNQGRQVLNPALQDVTFAGAARHGSAQHTPNRC